MVFHKIKKQVKQKHRESYSYLWVVFCIVFIVQYFFIKPKWYFKREELLRNCTGCEQAKRYALKDIENGQLCFMQFGLLTTEDIKFFKVFNNEYHVFVISGGCISDSNINCYNQIMLAKIQGRFGQNVFDKVWKSIK